MSMYNKLNENADSISRYGVHYRDSDALPFLIMENGDIHLGRFGMMHGDGEYRFDLGLCDIASFMIRYRMIKKTYIHNISYRNADGHYALDIRQLKNEHIFKYCPDKFVRYNSLSLEIN